MTTNQEGSPLARLSHFKSVASRFCEFVATTKSYNSEELLMLASILSELCSVAYSLPETDPVRESELNEQELNSLQSKRKSVMSMLALGLPQDYYRSVESLSIYEEPKFTVGQLSDDLSDIWLELKIGLRYWREGGKSWCLLSGWHWKFTFESHWGGHAVSALVVLHQLIKLS